MWIPSQLRTIVGVCAAITSAAFASACYAEAGAQPVYVESAPPAYVDHGPVYYYEGRPAYYVNSRWYVRDGRRWHYYRNEPPTLYRQRLRVQPAPPAYGRGPGHGHRTAPERRVPNAVRVR